MADHAWCHDIARDAAVRAAEDNRTGPLPTLAEAIAAVRERRSDHTKGEEMSQGITTERVTLEERITLEFSFDHRSNFRPKEWAATFLPGAVCQGISVRVVEQAVGSVDDRAYADRMGCDEERDFANRILAERDAAIREREGLRVKRDELQTGCNRLNAQLAKKDSPYKTALDAAIKGMERAQRERDDAINEYHSVSAERDAAIRERDTLKARLKDSQNCSGKFWSQILVVASERDKLKARVAELEAASGGGAGEPVAWMCEWTDHVGLHHTKTDAEDEANGDVVPQPLYRAPPQPRGWLTGEEKAAIRWAMSEGFDEEVLRALLARSTPPEVVLPGLFALSLLGDRLLIESQVKEALTAAGVAVKEVG
jgi:hypothetical protein